MSLSSRDTISSTMQGAIYDAATAIGPSGAAAVAAISEDAKETLRSLARAGTGENRRGVTLALASSIFIGASFIIKKKGLMAAGQSGAVRASAGGYSYLRQPLWWIGLTTMIAGEAANLAAYAYAPAIVVTPLGASTIIISAILANFFLGESMHACGVLACFLAVVGSVVLVSHAPAEAPIESVEEIWALATQPQFLVYSAVVTGISLLLIYRLAPRYGRSHLLVYVLICSLIGSLSVVSCKAIGIAVKLTMRGSNQLFKRETCAFLATVAICVVVQMNYLNKALDTFNTAVVSSTYYGCFTTCTITASMIMYKDWEGQGAGSITMQVTGFLILMAGVYILTVTRDASSGCSAGLRVLMGRQRSTEYQLCETYDDEAAYDDKPYSENDPLNPAAAEVQRRGSRREGQ